MAIAYDNSATTDYVSGTATQSFVVSSSSGRCIVAAAPFNVSGITYAGTAFALAASFDPPINDGNDQPIKVWVLLGAASGDNNIVITGSGDGTVSYVSYTGVKQVSNPEASDSKYSNDGFNNTQVVSLNHSLATSTNNSWTVLCAKGGNNTQNFGTSTSGTFRTSGWRLFGQGTMGIYDSGAAITPAGTSSTLEAKWVSGSGFVSIIIMTLAPEFESSGSFMPYFI
jgi:hypothetical protein